MGVAWILTRHTPSRHCLQRKLVAYSPASLPTTGPVPIADTALASASASASLPDISTIAAGASSLPAVTLEREEEQGADENADVDGDAMTALPPTPLEGQETRIIIQDDGDDGDGDGARLGFMSSAVLPTAAASRPRIGGWYVGQPRPSAVAPPLVVPVGAPLDDDDDRPLLEDAVSALGGSNGSGNGIGAFWDRPWTQAKADARAQAQTQREEEEQLIQRQREREREQLQREREALLQRARQATSDGGDGDDGLDLQKRILATTSSTHLPDWIILELQRRVRLGQFAGDDEVASSSGAAGTAPPPLSKRRVWVVPLLTKDDARDDSVPTLVWVPHRFQYTVVDLPHRLCLELATDLHLLDDQTAPPGPTKEPTPPPTLPSPPPRDEAIADLERRLALVEAENTALTQASASHASRLDSAESARAAAENNAQLSRQLYNDASKAAREAMAESAALEERNEKLQRQLRDGLAAHREQHRAARAQWLEEQRQLRARIALLEGQTRRFDDAQVRKKVNEWRVEKLSEQEAERKRQRMRRLEEERRALEEEIDMDELAALREDQQQSGGGGGGDHGGETPAPSIAIELQGPFARATARRGDDADVSATTTTASAHSIVSAQNREAARMLEEERRAANASGAMSLGAVLNDEGAREKEQDRLRIAALDDLERGRGRGSGDGAGGDSTASTTSSRRQSSHFMRTLRDAQNAQQAHQEQLARSRQEIDEQMDMWERGAESEGRTRADLEREFFGLHRDADADAEGGGGGGSGSDAELLVGDSGVLVNGGGVANGVQGEDTQAGATALAPASATTALASAAAPQDEADYIQWTRDSEA